MRNFFYKLLAQLDKLTGIKQWDKLQATAVPEKEINELLDILCRVCEQFPFIPDKDMQGILSHAVVADGDFIGLNAKFIYKHLALNKDKYFRELQHMPTNEEQGEPLTGEAKEKAIAEWLQAVQGLQTHVTVPKDNIKRVGEQWPKLEGYHSPTLDQVFDKENHLAWIRANFDKNGNKLPEWMEEQAWIQQQLEKES